MSDIKTLILKKKLDLKVKFGKKKICFKLKRIFNAYKILIPEVIANRTFVQGPYVKLHIVHI